MSNLVDHARRELELLGEDEETINGMLKVVQAFADMGHSGGSAMVCIPMLNDLLQYKNLTPLTNDPDEWMVVDGFPTTTWQNRRRSEAFSTDEGRHYTLLSENVGDEVTPVHTSEEKQT